MKLNKAADGTERVVFAEAKMNSARERLLSYVEKRSAINGDEYRRLAAKVKKAEAEFMRAMARSGN
jgi:hypothetical protein